MRLEQYKRKFAKAKAIYGRCVLVGYDPPRWDNYMLFGK